MQNVMDPCASLKNLTKMRLSCKNIKYRLN